MTKQNAKMFSLLKIRGARGVMKEVNAAPITPFIPLTLRGIS